MACVVAPPPALLAGFSTRLAHCSCSAAYRQRQLRSRDQGSEQELRGDNGGPGRILRETPDAALGSWGHCPAFDNCDCVLPALPDGILAAMVDAELSPGCQPLLSCAGKCPALRAERRR